MVGCWPGFSRVSDQFVLDGVVDQFCILFHLHFFQYAGPVGADGFDTQGQLNADFGEGFAGRDHGKYLVFTV